MWGSTNTSRHINVQYLNISMHTKCEVKEYGDGDSWVGHLWFKWVGHFWLKWVEHLWFKWVGQLGQSELLFLRDMLKTSGLHESTLSGHCI